MATDRIIVESEVKKPFIDKLVARAAALRVGDPSNPETQIGAVISSDVTRRMTAIVEDARQKGATVHSGGKAKGPLFQPTVIGDVTPGMRIYEEEIFGPLVAVVTVDNEQEAIRVANDTKYGLSGAVFGRDVSAALRVAQAIDTGICHINGATVHDEPQIPFGGVKDSGWGRFGGDAGIHEFTELRWLTIQTKPRHYPI